MLDLKLRIDEFPFNAVAVLGFPLELLQDTFSGPWVDVFVVLKHLRWGQRASEFCLHGNKSALLCRLLLAPLFVLLIGKTGLLGALLALFASSTPACHALCHP